VDEGKLSLESKDIAAEKRQELLRLFPEAETEGGKIDFDQLKRALGESVDPGRERYGMNWPGKADCFRLIQSPSTATLLPVRQESVRFDETENMIIEGDNLEVLKLLQKGYQNKVKMIYIDPPYNTGNDFIYPDDFSDNLKNYLQYTGQVGAEGKSFSNNLDTDGRFHSKWLNMMYPRLYLARNLLRDDGVVFISIGDHEEATLKLLCDSIFGDENFIAIVIWQKVFSPKNTAQHFSDDHEYVLVYAKNSTTWRPYLLERSAESIERYTNPDNDPRGPWTSGAMQARNFYSKGQYEVESPSGRKFSNPKGTYWRFSHEKFLDLDKDNRVWWGDSGNNVPRLKRFLTDVKSGVVPQTLWTYQDVGHTQESKAELLSFVEFESTENVLNSVKPTRLIRKMLRIGTSSEDPEIVLDFFAGSGPTGHAVIDQNLADGGNRKFILVQIPEPLQIEEAKVKTIADLTKSRIAKVIERHDQSAEGTLQMEEVGTVPHKDGFRVFKLAPSNFKVWDAHTDEGVAGVERQMELAVNHIMPDRSAEDLFYEILMKSEFQLTAKAEIFDAAGIKAFSVEDDALIVCVERKVTAEAVAAIAKRSPSKVIFLDEAFSGNDQLKANAKMNFESAGVKRFETV